MHKTLVEIVGLFALGIGSRLVPHFPNMTALNAVALKSRAQFGPAGLIIPLASMIVSDAVIGLYDWRLLLSVYASFTLIGMLGVLVQRTRSVSMIASVSTLGSVLFFLITNTCVWALASWYPHNIRGLLACYAAGLPFLYTMLAGDLLFSFALFRLRLSTWHVHIPHLTRFPIPKAIPNEGR